MQGLLVELIISIFILFLITFIMFGAQSYRFGSYFRKKYPKQWIESSELIFGRIGETGFFRDFIGKHAELSGDSRLMQQLKLRNQLRVAFFVIVIVFVVLVIIYGISYSI